LGEVSKSSSLYLFDVGLFGSKETLCLLLPQGVVDSWIRFVLTVGPYTTHLTFTGVVFISLYHPIELAYTLCGLIGLQDIPTLLNCHLFLFYIIGLLPYKNK